MTDIVLATLNARWSHASLGLRYLLANLGELEAHACIEEFTLATPIQTVVERLLAHGPRVLGLGIYIWNVERSLELIKALRIADPALVIVLGGPEVSHETERQQIVQAADHVITGPGELGFATLARQLLRGPRPLMKVIAGAQPDLDALVLPYGLYTDTDIAHRHLYIEASRGCPYKCEFCLSALDRTAWPFPLDRVLDALSALHARGARRFKFVDRTFNLKVSTSRAILEFMLARIEATPDDPIFAHFELVPDHLPEALRDIIVRFPPGTLQFEIGIQSWNPAVQRLVSRRQDNERAEHNLTWLREQSQAHLHVDLIAGLPGEDLASFSAGFDRLHALRPHEIQLGMLKRLNGAPIVRHVASHALRFSAQAPYTILSSSTLSAEEVIRIARFARYWDLYANSGRFTRTLAAWLPASEPAFERFMGFSDQLSSKLGATHHIALERLAEALHDHLVKDCGWSVAMASEVLAEDYAAAGARGRPAFLPAGLSGGGARQPRADEALPRANPACVTPTDAPASASLRRQSRHVRRRPPASPDAEEAGT